MYITLGLNQVHYAVHLTEMFQPPCNKYDRWRHRVNKFELHPPKNVISNMLELYELIQDLREF